MRLQISVEFLGVILPFGSIAHIHSLSSGLNELHIGIIQQSFSYILLISFRNISPKLEALSPPSNMELIHIRSSPIPSSVLLKITPVDSGGAFILVECVHFPLLELCIFGRVSICNIWLSIGLTTPDFPSRS